MKRKLLYLASLMLVFSGLLGLIQTQTARATGWPSPVTATPPTFVDPTCQTAGSYTIPAKHHVSYQVSTNSWGPYSTKASGTYQVTNGQTIYVRAVADFGYYISGNDDWSHKFELKTTCVQPNPVVFSDPTCEVDHGTYTIPYKKGVYYKVGGVTKSAGTYNVATGESVTVMAYASYGYTLYGTTTWSHTFAVNESCVEEVTPAEVTFVDPTCEVSGTYTIPETEGVAYQIDGVTVAAGTYSANDGESVTVNAVALEGYVLTGTTSWSHEFSIEGECVEQKAVINYDVVCGRDGATVTFTNTGNISGEVVLNGEVITIEAGATEERLVETGRDGQKITIVVGDETVYDQLVDCDKGEVLGGSTVRPTTLPETSGDASVIAVAFLAMAGAALSGLSFAARRLTARSII